MAFHRAQVGGVPEVPVQRAEGLEVVGGVGQFLAAGAVGERGHHVAHDGVAGHAVNAIDPRVGRGEGAGRGRVRVKLQAGERLEGRPVVLGEAGDLDPLHAEVVEFGVPSLAVAVAARGVRGEHVGATAGAAAHDGRLVDGAVGGQ